MLHCSTLCVRCSKGTKMRGSDKQWRPRPDISFDEEPMFDTTAVCFATWLGLLILVRVFELLPSLPVIPNPQDIPLAQMWTTMSFAL